MNKTTTMKHILSLLITFFLCSSLSAQTITVKGKVTYEDGEEAIGTSVVEKDNPSNGTMADVDGNYSINVPSNATLTFSMVGCETQSISVNGRTEINVKLEEASYSITDDPVYYVYTTDMLNRDISASKTAYAGMDKLGRPNSEESIFQGTLSGVYLNPAERANESYAYIRGGNRSIDANVRYVVDGIPDAPFDPSSVLSAYATKDVASSSTFGTTAASGGVMHIKTKEYNDSYNKHILNINTWMGMQEVSHLLPGNNKKLFDGEFQKGFVQHYDVTLGRRVDRTKLIWATSFDNIEGVVKSTRAENLTTTLKGETDLFSWLSAGQHIYYRHSKESFPTMFNDYPNITNLDITKYKPEETIHSATFLEGKAKDWLNIKTIFTYKKTDREISYNQYDPYNTTTRKILWDNTATFNKQWDYHHLRALLGYTYNNREFKFLQYNKYNHKLTTNDILLRAAYNYRNDTRSLVAAVKRSSISENIDKDYAYFPSVSATWNIAGESFAYDSYKFYNTFSMLRLRAAWGKIGSIGFDTWDKHSDIFSDYYFAFLLPHNLKWQTTDQWNVGLDFTLSNTPLNFTVNYFNKRTNNIPQIPINDLTQTLDYAEITNRGWEFETSYNFYINRYDHYFALKANMTLYNSSVKINEDYALPAGDYLAPDNFYGFGITYGWKNLRVETLLQGATNAKLETQSYLQPYIESDYITLKSLNISVINIPLQKITKSYSSRAVIYANIENMFTNLNSDIDSEILSYYNYPLRRTYSLGLRLSF